MADSRSEPKACEVVALGAADGALAHVAAWPRPVRVAGGVPGDRGLLRVRHWGQHAAWGELVELHQPSPDRVTAPCPQVLRCGGCPWQMVAPDRQRSERLMRVEAALSPWLDGGQVRWHDGSARTGLRTRASVVLAQRGGKLRWGFWAPGTHEWVEGTGCVAHDPRVNAMLDRAVAVLGRAGHLAWDERRQRGHLQGLAVRIDPRSGHGLLTVIARDQSGLSTTAAELLRTPGIRGVSVQQVERTGGPASQTAPLLLAGEARLTQTWQGPDGKLVMAVGPGTFVQTRHDGGEQLLAAIAAALPAQMHHLLDLYAGCGVTGLALRGRCHRLTLAERAGGAADDTHHHLAGHPDPAVAVHTGDAAELLASLAAADVDAAVVDPPRAGCGDAVVGGLSALPQLHTVVYVSCGQAGLLRDMKAFAAAGWRVREVRLVDLFVDTPHVEVVVQLVRPLLSSGGQKKRSRRKVTADTGE